MDKRHELAGRLSDSLEFLIMQFKSVDVSCMQIKSDLSSRDFHLLSYIGQRDNIIMKDIADELGVPMSTATGIVDKLVQKGYLKRMYSAADRRIVLIDLDTEGKEAFELFTKMKYEATKRIISMLSIEDAEIFTNYLEQIAQNFAAEVELG